ncbi:MAG: DUF6279 family lipoprotein, partial [Steroidobacteraceae bacterium]
MTARDAAMARRRVASGRRCVLACLFPMLLAGCGASLLYPRLDTLVGLYLRGLVSLDDRQEMQLARTLERNLDWHRREELERYDGFLREMAREVGTGLDRATLENAAERAEAYWRRNFEQAAPGYAALAATLTDAQVRELLLNIERADHKTWQEYAGRTAEDRVRNRGKAVRKGIERITGTLDARQRALVAAYATDAQ